MKRLFLLTEHVADVDLQDEPAVCLLSVRAKDSKDGALLARLGQQLVHVHLLLGELELAPCLALVGAVPAPQAARHLRKQEDHFNLCVCVCVFLAQTSNSSSARRDWIFSRDAAQEFRAALCFHQLYMLLCFKLYLSLSLSLNI